MPFNRVQLYETDRTWLSKFILRTLLAVLAIAAIGCYASNVARLSFQSFYYNAGFVDFVFIPLGLSVLWYLISTVYLFVKSRPVHPGWHVGWDLLLTAGYIVFNIFLWYQAVYDYTSIESYEWSYSDYGYDDQPDQADLNRYKTLVRVQLAGVIFLAIILLLHFTLFIWACVDTEARRRNKTARRMAYDMISEMRARGELPPVQYPMHNDPGDLAYASPSHGSATQAHY